MCKFKRLLQPDNKNCVATCCAMVTGESVEYVLDWFGSGLGYTAEDMILFFAHHGVYLAFYAIPEDGKHFKLSSEEGEEVSLIRPIKDHPALLTVLSKRFPGKLHQVFWTGKIVLDPSPGSPSERKIEDYKIVEYWPVIWTAERGRALC